MSFLAGVAVGIGACFVVFVIATIWIGTLIEAQYSEQEKIRQEKERLIQSEKGDSSK